MNIFIPVLFIDSGDSKYRTVELGMCVTECAVPRERVGFREKREREVCVCVRWL